MFVSMLILWY